MNIYNEEEAEDDEVKENVVGKLEEDEYGEGKLEKIEVEEVEYDNENEEEDTPFFVYEEISKKKSSNFRYY